MRLLNIFVRIIILYISYFCLTFAYYKSRNSKKYTMFSADNLKKMTTTLVIVMVALAVHQKFVAPMLAKKSTPPATK